MISEELGQKLFDYIPRMILNGVEIPRFRAGQVIEKPSYPYISVGNPSAGSRTKPWLNNSVLRVFKDGDGNFNDVVGQYHKSVVTVFIRSLDKQERNKIAAGLLRQLFKQKFDFSIENDGFRFVDVMAPTFNADEKDRQASKKVYLAIIDLEFEYELSWIDNSDPEIRRFNIVANDEIQITQGFEVKYLGYAISVPVLAQRSYGYTMSTKLVEV